MGMASFGAPATFGGFFMMLFGGMLNGYAAWPEAQPLGAPLVILGLDVIFGGVVLWVKGY